ncbi:MAG: hypothetical protein Q8O66_00840 [bacterium]|nr:hypothetical protein [bacterium]
MTIKNSRNELKRIGFFHATGLIAFNGQTDEECTLQAHRHELGSWGCNNHWVIVVLENGEIWLRAYAGKPDNEIRSVLRRLCPKGQGASIPFSAHEIISYYQIALRIGNPHDNCSGCADPTPRPQ